MKSELIARLKKSESDLAAYEAFRKDTSVSIADKKVVEFAYLFELFAFTAIHDLVPEYIPNKSTQIQIAQALGGTRGYVTVEDGKVKISPDYYAFLAHAQEMKTKKDGKLA